MKFLIEIVKILGRCKSKYSIMKKFFRDGRLLEEVFDVLGFRVIFVFREGFSLLKDNGVRVCYRVLEIVIILWEELFGRLKDYIVKLKKNGYVSLYLVVILSNCGNWVFFMEIQICIVEMDVMVEGGFVLYFLYKGGFIDFEQVIFCMYLSCYQV